MNHHRIAIIGLGQRIAHVLAAMVEVGWLLEVAGYADPAPVGLTILAEHGVDPGRAYPGPAALLAYGPFDLVMIGSPNHLHLAHLEAALTAGYPIFCEKPIVRTRVETMALAARLAGGPIPPLYVGLVMRSMPLVRAVIARLDGGELGELISIDATSHLHPEHGAYLARNWRRKQDWGGSFLLDKVCHDFDIFSRLAGSRAMRVASFGGRRIFAGAPAERAYSDGEAAYALRDAGWAGAPDAFASDMDVADHQVAIVRYASGPTLSFHANSHVGLIERRWYLAGSEGTLIADVDRNKLMVRRALDRKKPERIDFGGPTADLHNGADQAMAFDLKGAVEAGAAFPVSAREAMEAGLTVMAIDEAAGRGEAVDLAPLWAEFDAAGASPDVSVFEAKSLV